MIEALEKLASSTVLERREGYYPPISRADADLWLTVGVQDVTRDGKPVQVRWVAIGEGPRRTDLLCHIVGDKPDILTTEALEKLGDDRVSALIKRFGAG